MDAAIARILLRYASSALVAKGFMAPEVGNQLAVDPDVFQFAQVAIGLGLGAASECWYWLAKRWGWNT